MSPAPEPVQGPPPWPRCAFNPHAEHGLKHLRYQDRFHRPGRLDATILQDNNVIAILRCQIHIMDRHESGHTHATNEIEDFELVSDIQVVGGLVEDQDTGLLNKGARDQRPLFFPPDSVPNDRAASSVMLT